MATPMKKASGTQMMVNQLTPVGICTVVVVPLPWGIVKVWMVYSEAMAPVIADRMPNPIRLIQMSLQFAVGNSWLNEATPGFVVTLIHFCQIWPIPAGTGWPSGAA